MRNKSVIILIAVCFHFGALAALSQKTGNTMTNVDVVELSKAGLDESTIILAIQRSETDFDTSTKALIELHRNGLSSKILEAMLRPKTESQTPNEQFSDIATNEVLLIDGKTEKLMKRSRPDFDYNMGYFSRKGSFVSFGNRAAQQRVDDRTPEFKVSLPSNVNAEENFVLVRLTPRSGKREIEILNWRNPGRKIEYPKEAVSPLAFEEIRDYVTASGTKYVLYRVRAVNPLPPGEYAFVPQPRLFKYFDFGID